MNGTDTACEQAFVDRMKPLMDEGMDFAVVAQETLVDTMGETPSQVLFKVIGKAGIMRPDLFAQRVSQFFEEGASDLLAAVESRALKWREIGSVAVTASAYESLMGTLISVASYSSYNSGTVLLHDHRIKDELGSYAEDE